MTARRSVLLVATLAAVFLLVPAASSQPAAPPKAPPKATGRVAPPRPGGGKAADAKAKSKQPKGPPRADGLPNWHPPVQPPPRRQPPRRPRPGANTRKLLDPLQPKGLPGAATQGLKKKFKYPRDEHGFCQGRGIDDRPPDVNLMHGWLGIDNEKAEPRPRIERAPSGETTSDYLSRVWPYWKWRLVPYPYRYENHDDKCDPRNQPIPLLANIVNVGALLFLFVRFGRRPVRKALKERRNAIMKEIDEARVLKRNARKRLEHFQDELDHLDDKLDGMREQYAAEAEVDEKRVVNDAGEARDRLIADAEFQISQEGKQARDELSRSALEEAIAAAEAVLKRSVNASDHDRLAEEFLEHLDTALSGDALRPKGESQRGGRA